MCNWKRVLLTLGGLAIMGTAAIGVAAESKDGEKVLRHAVFFKFREGTSDEEIAKVAKAFAALKDKVDSIKDYQAGKNISKLGFDDGFKNCYLLTFDDEAGRAKYLPHPDHKAFGAGLGPNLEKVFVIDYWGKPEKNRKDHELKHALFVKFKSDASKEEIQSAVQAIEQLTAKCDAVKAFEWGTNNSPEKFDDGFTHCFMFTFNDKDGLKSYVEMPELRDVVAKVQEVAEKARVFDYWTDGTAGDGEK
jgi:quinol monooxygenase YgiN